MQRIVPGWTDRIAYSGGAKAGNRSNTCQVKAETQVAVKMRTTQHNQILLSLVGNVGSRIRMIDDSTVAGTILQRYIKLLRSINLQTNIL